MEDLDRRLFDGRELRIEWSKKDASGERRRSLSRDKELVEESKQGQEASKKQEQKC